MNRDADRRDLLAKRETESGALDFQVSIKQTELKLFRRITNRFRKQSPRSETIFDAVETALSPSQQLPEAPGVKAERPPVERLPRSIVYTKPLQFLLRRMNPTTSTVEQSWETFNIINLRTPNILLIRVFCGFWSSGGSGQYFVLSQTTPSRLPSSSGRRKREGVFGRARTTSLHVDRIIFRKALGTVLLFLASMACNREITDVSSWDGTVSANDFPMAARAFAHSWKEHNQSYPPWSWLPCPKQTSISPVKSLCHQPIYRPFCLNCLRSIVVPCNCRLPFCGIFTFASLTLSGRRIPVVGEGMHFRNK